MPSTPPAASDPVASARAVKQAPTGDDYNRLYQLANGGLLDLLKALGDPSSTAAD